MSSQFSPADYFEIDIDLTTGEAKATIEGERWEALSPAQQTLIEEAAKAAALHEVYAGYRDELTVAVVSFGDPDDRWWVRDIAREIEDEYDSDGRRAQPSYRQFRGE